MTSIISSFSPPATRPSAGILEIDCTAILHNWQIFDNLGSATTAGVVKANAYGLGMIPVATTLAKAGCHSFFVANLNEAIELRNHLSHVEIFVFNGPLSGEEHIYLNYRLIPVLNTPQQLDLWRPLSAHPAALQIDTGMTRLGLDPLDIAQTQGLNLCLILSHLSCANTPDHPANLRQLNDFKQISSYFPKIPLSLSASAGVLLGSDYGFDMVRPGIGLYGGNPISSRPNPCANVVTLKLPIIQIRTVEKSVAIGYNETTSTSAPTRILTLAAGYADGLLRSLGSHGVVMYQGISLPIIGQVSMDLMTVDGYRLGDKAINVGDWVEVLGAKLGIDKMAEAAETISYEILTGLGTRYQRVYR